MVGTHIIKSVTFQENLILLHIDGKEFKFPIEKVSNKLMSATDLQRKLYIVSPSGYGIHWPLIDEDLSVDAMLKIAGI
jgi:hypothetical protein